MQHASTKICKKPAAIQRYPENVEQHNHSTSRKMQALCDKPKDQKEVQCRIHHMQRRLPSHTWFRSQPANGTAHHTGGKLRKSCQHQSR